MSYKSTNPKDILAVNKTPLELLPPAAVIELAMALRHGAKKYGAWNWRDTGVRPEVYLGAALRHLLSWQSGEEVDRESGIHHLGHVMACCAIILDARLHDVLLDWETPLRDGTDALYLEMTNNTVRTENERTGKEPGDRS